VSNISHPANGDSNYYDSSADGLRGIAAMNVVIAHFLGAFYPSALHHHYPNAFPSSNDGSTLASLLQFPIISGFFFNGNFAVLVFFVLSGYVLTLPYHQAQGRAKLQQRLVARYFRLNIPIFFSIVVSYSIFELGGYSNIEAAQISKSDWFLNYFNSQIAFKEFLNLAFWKSIFFGDGRLNPPLWTLQVEFVGSLIILLYFSLVGDTRNNPPRVLVAKVMVLCLAAVFLFGRNSIYYVAIFLGAIVPLFRINRFAWIGFVVGLYFGCYSYNSAAYNFLPSFDYFNTKTTYSFLGAIFLTISIANGFASRVLNGQIFQFLGRLTFSLYLVHFIVLSSICSWMYVELVPDIISFMSLFLFYLAACLFLSYFFHEYVDKKAIKYSHLFGVLVLKWKNQRFGP
jgi:peptidoglycan/LPS O-acetylase OafA/YrhL